ncbi:MAG: MSMEG_0565 family glycosyltransferase [Candidatus Bathyarchaeota archaeon]
MKIALLTYTTKPRGGVVHATFLAENMAKLGHQVCLFALDEEGNRKFYRNLNVDYEVYPVPRNTGSLSGRVGNFIKGYVENLPHDFDIYHAQDCIGVNALCALKRKKMISSPTVRTVHHVDTFSEKFLVKLQEKSIKCCGFNIVVSRYWQKKLMKDYGLKSEVIHNGVDTSKFNLNVKGDRLRKRLSLGSNVPVILSVSGYEPRKGLEYLILAMDHVIRDFHDARLLVIGRKALDFNIKEKACLQRLAKRSGIDRSVAYFEGVDSDVLSQFYAVADVFVLSSRLEGWGLSVMEAMSVGKPVIVTDTGSISEYVKNDFSGFLVPPGDTMALASKIKHVLRNRRLAERVGRRANQMVSKYSWEETARKTVRFYERVLLKWKNS